ncbi:hypothetical protein LCGC14_2828650, partial [marine sediment metagenome]
MRAHKKRRHCRPPSMYGLRIGTGQLTYSSTSWMFSGTKLFTLAKYPRIAFSSFSLACCSVPARVMQPGRDGQLAVKSPNTPRRIRTHNFTSCLHAAPRRQLPRPLSLPIHCRRSRVRPSRPSTERPLSGRTRQALWRGTNRTTSRKELQSAFLGSLDVTLPKRPSVATDRPEQTARGDERILRHRREGCKD